MSPTNLAAKGNHQMHTEFLHDRIRADLNLPSFAAVTDAQLEAWRAKGHEPAAQRLWNANSEYRLLRGLVMPLGKEGFAIRDDEQDAPLIMAPAPKPSQPGESDSERLSRQDRERS